MRQKTSATITPLREAKSNGGRCLRGYQTW